MSNAEEVGGDGAITQLPSDGSEFRNPLRRSGGSTSSMPNYRLPTPGGALPAGRLPPLNRDGAMDEPGTLVMIYKKHLIRNICQIWRNFSNKPYA